MSSARLYCLLTLMAAAAFGQPREFDAASVKPAAQNEGLIQPIEQVTPGRITIRNYVVKKLVMEAYELSRFQVDGPPWIERDRFDIVATKPSGTGADDQRAMLQSLLASRFHLVKHRETRQSQTYVLLAGQDTSKLHAVKEDATDPACGRSGTMARFAQNLATILDKPVIDQTGISGRYYFILTWSSQPVVVPQGGAPPPPPPPSADGCPSWSGKMPPVESNLFGAVREQMGLRLEHKGAVPIDVMVLDHVERPSKN